MLPVGRLYVCTAWEVRSVCVESLQQSDAEKYGHKSVLVGGIVGLKGMVVAGVCMVSWHAWHGTMPWAMKLLSIQWPLMHFAYEDWLAHDMDHGR